MSNPWTFDKDEIPEDRRARARKRRLRIVGLFLWGLVVGSLTVLLVTDTGDLTASQVLSLAALSIGTAVVAIGLGALALIVLRYLSILGKIGFGLGFLFFLFVVLPPLVSFALENVSLFENIPTDTEQPLRDLLDFVRDQSSIS